MENIKSTKLIHQEISFKIIGCAFEVYNTLGPGHLEHVYQKALALEFKCKQIAFDEQVKFSLEFKSQKCGYYFVDFLVEENVIVEIKRDIQSGRKYFNQVLNYLHTSKLALTLLIQFGPDKVYLKRIVLEQYLKEQTKHNTSSL